MSVKSVAIQEIDSNSISVVPLGGRHVNHFWRLLKFLKIPYVTLLDFDIDRNGGGFGRMKYAVEQVVNVGRETGFIKSSILRAIPKWDDERDPNEFELEFTKGRPEPVLKNIVEALEECNVFFSSPLDLDYSMISAFPEIFCIADEANGEQGPNEIAEGKDKNLIDAVLKSSNSGIRYDFGDGYLNKFLWYRYRFLSNKSKPASHLRMFSLIEKKYTNEKIISKLPPELIRLLNRVVKISEETVE